MCAGTHSLRIGGRGVLHTIPSVLVEPFLGMSTRKDSWGHEATGPARGTGTGRKMSIEEQTKDGI